MGRGGSNLIIEHIFLEKYPVQLCVTWYPEIKIIRNFFKFEINCSVLNGKMSHRIESLQTELIEHLQIWSQKLAMEDFLLLFFLLLLFLLSFLSMS